jgi:hypothetical protein
MPDISPELREKLHALATQAYERELCHALEALAERFQAWRAGKLEVDELVAAIHEFDDGSAQEIASRYDERHYLVMQVAYGVVAGLISSAEIPAEAWPFIQQAMRFYQQTNR